MQEDLHARIRQPRELRRGYTPAWRSDRPPTPQVRQSPQGSYNQLTGLSEEGVLSRSVGRVERVRTAGREPTDRLKRRRMPDEGGRRRRGAIVDGLARNRLDVRSSEILAARFARAVPRRRSLARHLADVMAGTRCPRLAACMTPGGSRVASMAGLGGSGHAAIAQRGHPRSGQRCQHEPDCHTAFTHGPVPVDWAAFSTAGTPPRFVTVSLAGFHSATQTRPDAHHCAMSMRLGAV